MGQDKLTLDISQANDFQKALRRARGSDGSKWEPDILWWLRQDFLLGKVLDVVQGRADIIPIGEVNTIVSIDRSAPLTYPDWVKGALHPELENVGPEKIDLANLGHLSLPKQITDSAGYLEVFQYLRDNDLLKNCLGFREAEEIRKKGVNFFRKHFGNKPVYFWKNIAEEKNGNPLLLMAQAYWHTVEIGGTPCFNREEPILCYQD